MKLTPHSNAAARLLGVIEAIQATPANQRVNSSMSSLTARQGWEQILGLEQARFPQLLTRIAKVYQLPLLAAREIDLLPLEDKSLLLKWKPCVTNILEVRNFDLPWQQVINYIQKDQIESLRFADFQICQLRPTSVATPAELEQIREQLLKTLRALNDAVGLPEDLRQYLLLKIHEMELALVDYLILGARPIARNLDETVGWICRHGYEAHFQKEGQSESTTSFRDMLRLISDLLNVHEKGAKFIKGFLGESQDTIDQ